MQNLVNFSGLERSGPKKFAIDRSGLRCSLGVSIGWVLAALLMCSACTADTISVLTAADSTSVAFDSPIRVVLDARDVRLPLHVSGDDVVFSDLDRALERTLELRLEPSREGVRRRGARPLEVFVELVQARAELREGRLNVDLTARATLRERTGLYLAQTHARTSVAGVATSAHGVVIVRQAADALAVKIADFVAASLPP